MNRQSTNVVRGIYEAFGRGDIPAVLEVLDSRVAWIEPESRHLPFAGVHHGVTAVVDEVFATVPALWDEFQLVPDEFLGTDGAVAVTGEFRVRAKGGTAFTTPFAHIWKLRNQKVVSFSNYMDTAVFVEALRGTGEAAAPERAVASA
jgi:ketosteroid isomerase-like protein